MTTQEIASITKDMIISDIIMKHPFAAEIMETYGLSCTGCSVNTMESIESGVKTHGLPDDRTEEIVKDINHAISSGKAPEPRTEETEEPAQEQEPLQVTEKAAEKMKSILASESKAGWGIRMIVSAGGCAGFTYGMDFSEKAGEGDQVLEFGGQKVFVDQQSAKLLSGVTVDYVDSLNEAGFKFDNPNAKASCGCGKSFS